MEREPKKAAKVAASLGRKLFRVLVMGGAVIAASCASVPKGSGSPSNGSKPAESDASRSGKSDGGKESGGGVPGW